MHRIVHVQPDARRKSNLIEFDCIMFRNDPFCRDMVRVSSDLFTWTEGFEKRSINDVLETYQRIIQR